ncbi:MAG: group II intron maturase-specific domain-containing protein [Dysosmobacter sp.]
MHRKSLAKAKEKLKILTKAQPWTRNVRRVMQEVKEFIRGWIGYFRAADMKRT